MSFDIGGVGGGQPLVIPVSVPPDSIAILTRIAEGIDAIGIKSEHAADKTAKAGVGFLQSFNAAHEFVNNLSARISSLADAVSTLASEQAALDANSARLGLNFNAAADAAGRFTDETEAMAAATRLAEAGIDLTQGQLDSLTQVAARFAQNTGTTVSSAIDTLTNGLITGSARGLRPFGDELARSGGSAHDAADRLAALTTQAEHTTRATNDAASSMAAFRDRIDDAKRTLASAFANGIVEVSRISEAADTASTRFEILDSDITRAGRTMALVVGAIGNGIALVVGGIATGVASMLSMAVGGVAAAGAVIDRLRDRNFSGLAGAARSAFNASTADSPITDALASFTSARANAGEGMFGAIGDALTGDAPTGAAAGRPPTPRRPSPGGGSDGDDDPRKTAKSAALAAQAQEREREMLQLRATRDLATEILRIERDRERLSRESADAIGEQVTHANELARINSRIASLQDESVVSAEVGVERARSRQGRAQGRVSQRATLEDLRDPGVQQDRAADAAQSRAVAREERLQQRRLDSMQSFTERWRDLHEQQVDSTQVAAEMLSSTFSSMGDAMRKHVEAAAEGRETAGEAVRGILADTLDALGKEAMIKGTLYAAEGLAALARYDFGGAATAFAASAAFIGAGALIGYAGSQVAPASPAAAPSAASGSSAGSSRVAGSSRPSNDNAAPATVNHFYAPVIGGRTVSDAEVGGRMNRYTDATSRRQVRQRA